MGLVSFAGRLLFVSVFVLLAYLEFNEFGVDGGKAAKALRPKFNRFAGHLTSELGLQLPEIEMKHLVAASIALRGLGSLFFIFDSFFGAYLLALNLTIFTPILCDFYNYDIDTPEFLRLFVQFTQNLSLVGALLFYIGMKNSMPRRQPKKRSPKRSQTKVD